MTQGRLVHIITGLDTGGAEMTLYKLLLTSRLLREASEVITLTRSGPIGEKIAALGVPVSALGMARGVPNPVKLLQLAGWLRRSRPDVVQTWMYHADLVGGLAARMAGVRAIAWGIRNSDLDPQTSKLGTILTVRACARLSSWVPERIICCSDASRRIHAELGYAAEKLSVIPNGFDVTAFKPDPAARRAVRDELDIPPDAPVIGFVARFDPQKDHRTFFRAAAILHGHCPDAHFVLCGGGIDENNRALTEWIAGPERRQCHLLGLRQDVPRIVAAFDVATSSSSYGEGFPNVVGEAMACGVPCVVTDVGDSALIVGDTGRVVPPGGPAVLAAAWLELIDMDASERVRLGATARQRVETHFDLNAIAARYERAYLEMGLPGGTGDVRH